MSVFSNAQEKKVSKDKQHLEIQGDLQDVNTSQVTAGSNCHQPCPSLILPNDGHPHSLCLLIGHGSLQIHNERLSLPQRTNNLSRKDKGLENGNIINGELRQKIEVTCSKSHSTSVTDLGTELRLPEFQSSTALSTRPFFLSLRSQSTGPQILQGRDQSFYLFCEVPTIFG